jgi:protein TonB
MTDKATFERAAGLSDNDSLLIALFFAAIIHVIIVLGVHFTTPESKKFTRSIDITLVNTPAPKAPKAAKFLAPEHQIGAGTEVKKPVAPKQQLPSRGDGEAKIVKKPAEIANKPKSVEKILTQPIAAKKIVTESKSEDGDSPERPHLTAEMLRNQLAQFGTEIRLSQQSGDLGKIKTVSQVSAHKFMAAQYQKDWETKVERIGNLNYPAIATQKNFSGQLMVAVGIKADGNIDHITVTRSSGNLALDEAAKNIVKMSAPFAPLPIDLLKELNVLVITRVWKFSDESGMSTH